MEGGTGQAASDQSCMDFSHTYSLPVGRRHSRSRHLIMEGRHRYRRGPAKVSLNLLESLATDDLDYLDNPSAQ
jgi:hypothetical protein